MSRAIQRIIVPVLAVTFALTSTGLIAAPGGKGGGGGGGERTTTVRWGPIDLPAATSEGPGEVHNELAGVSGFSAFLLGFFTELADYEVNKPCEDCYIVAVEPNLVLADGTTGNYNNGTMLHHVVNLNYSRPDVTCQPDLFSDQTIKALGGAAGGNERFFAAGNERTIMNLADGYGYYVGSGDEWGLTYHVMNMQPQPKTVYFEYTFTWVSANKAKGIEAVRPIWVDIDQCNDSEVAVPAGYSDVHWSWQADRTHKVTDIGGHVHNYGLSIAWENESTNQNICTSVAGYSAGSPYAPTGPGTGADVQHPLDYNTVTSDPLGLDNYNGNIADMTVCSDGANGPTNAKGDLMTTHTQIYRPDETDHDMGIMIGYMDEELCLTDTWCY
ncbi:MAG: hypothetical protein HUJ31_08025 [Pseudomonadales bacterium]|nr:hypothetical protein [Pseudomonadales bacterium]